MTPAQRARGSAPVGVVSELPPLEMQVVRYLRLWCDGPEGQAEVWQDLASRLGTVRGAQALRNFESLMGLVLRNARRPLQRHGVACSCFGGDEAAFAQMVSYAHEGHTEDAGLVAALFVTPKVLPVVIAAALRTATSFGTAGGDPFSAPNVVQLRQHRMH
ncbi:hypothetical protein FDP22_05055 [Paroceanicella profunda]|uniref:Uncharacterized protein n=1 Tax=Paroceanicella profunda TaxID=2579971 RepID=A0A5B8FYG7_9RHOB|nr:hypothetical protein [Paroceanicella profunda]QDL91203.1 hypothetical protein FDP22_05055 [Paroceanicella profunda]